MGMWCCQYAVSAVGASEGGLVVEVAAGIASGMMRMQSSAEADGGVCRGTMP
jgi:hypothetical protein